MYMIFLRKCIRQLDCHNGSCWALSPSLTMPLNWPVFLFLLYLSNSKPRSGSFHNLSFPSSRSICKIHPGDPFKFCGTVCLSIQMVHLDELSEMIYVSFFISISIHMNLVYKLLIYTCFDLIICLIILTILTFII